MPKPVTIKPLTGHNNDFLKIVMPATATGKLDAVKDYLEQEPRFLKVIGPHGRTMLWEAARKGKLAMVQYLADRGADIDATGCYYSDTWVELTPWCIATVNKRVAVAEELLNRGARYDFYTACYLGDEKFVASKLRRSKRAANEPLERKHRWYPYAARPMHYALAGRQRAIIDALFKAGAEVQHDDGELLRWAVWSDDYDLARTLIKRGVALDAAGITDWGTDPKWKKLAQELGTKADIDAPDRLGYPPLVDACRGNHNAPDDPKRVQALLEQSATVNKRDYKQKTALHRASQAGFLKITELLLKRGADLEAVDRDEETPLFDAVRYGRLETIKLLLKRGAVVRHVNRKGQTVQAIAQRLKKPHAPQIRNILAAAMKGKSTKTRKKT